MTKKPNINLSIRDTISRALKGKCQSRNEGWWTYEFCFDRHLRQYHVQTLIDPRAGKQRNIIDTQHLLGVYQKPSHKKDMDEDDDENLIRNYSTTTNKDLTYSHDIKTYYELEYPNGEQCLHKEDAGSTTGDFPEGLERSTTIRFSCGKRYEILSVNEDSTCHYKMEVSVPDLCLHPKFHVEKTKQKHYDIKCLPVVE